MLSRQLQKGPGSLFPTAVLTRCPYKEWSGQGCRTTADSNFKANHKCYLNSRALPPVPTRSSTRCRCLPRPPRRHRRLSLNKRTAETCAFERKVLRTRGAHTARPLPQQAFLIAFAFSARWVRSHPFFHFLGILNAGFNISARGASASKGIGGDK